MKRVSSIILSFIMAFTIFVGVKTDNAFASETIKIYTVEDLYAINSNMNGHYVLMNDIDLSEATGQGGDWDFMGNGWEPIGSGGTYGDTPFTGTFDGNGYSVSGLRINATTNLPSGASKTIYFGLFSKNEGTIKNLCLRNSSISVDVTNHNYYLGSIAACNTNTGVIENCTSYVMINAKGNNEEVAWNTYQTIAEYAYIGGIVGCSDGDIIGCGNHGTIASDAYGLVHYGSVSMATYKGTFTSSVGGIVGATNGTIESCYNNGSITAKGSVYEYNSGGEGNVLSFKCGGLAGEFGSNTIENSYSTGNIDKQSSVKAKYYSLAAGGIAGNTTNTIINACYVSGTIVNGNGYSLSGNNAKFTASNTYYLSGTAQSQAGATALSLGQMKLQTCFSGFDFENTWLTDVDSDYGCPQLKGNRQDNKDIELVELATEPTTKQYYSGAEIDPAGGSVKIYYKDGSRETKDITTTMLRDYDMEVVGEQEVTVNYRDNLVTFTINVIERPEIDTLTLISEPNKKEFVKGTAFDFTGCQVKADYTNGTSEIIDVLAKNTEGGNINRLGTQTITYTLLGKSVEFEVKVIPVEIESIAVASPPNQTVFVEGKPIDTEGLTIKATYNNENEQLIDDYTLSELPTSIGTHEIEVSYSGCTTSFEVEIIEKSAVSISIKNGPDKTSYIVGQTFDPTGMVVEATFDNDDVLEVTDYSFGALPDAVGTGKVEIEYQGKKTYVNVTMRAKVMESISVTQRPDKINYIQDEDFDPSGLEVCVNYNNGNSEAITDYTLSNTGTSKLGNRSVVVLYEGMTTTFEITVIEKTAISLSVTPPTKASYIVGDDFDGTGMVVKVTYDNGKTEEVTDYELSGFGESDDEANLVTVSYKGMARSFIVTIHTPKAEWQVTTQPSCTTTGEKVLYCANCNEILDTAQIEATGHSWGTWETVTSPNCVDKGSEKRVCGECGIEEFKDVNPNGHAWVEEYVLDVNPTCISEGSESWHCSVCGVSDPTHTRTIEKLPHNLGDWSTTKEPTCAVAGVKQRACTDCDYLETGEVPATGNHSFGEWTTVKEPTCTEKGYKERECSVCHLVETNDIAATGKHDYGEWATVKDPTCTENGSKERSCSMCGEKETESVSATGHKWNSSYTIDKKATYAAAGSKSIHCSVCNAKKPGSAVSVPKLKVKAVALTKVTAVKKGFTAKWKKGTSINGYELQYALNSKFTKSKKTVKITKTATVSKKVTKLKAKKKYYVRVRAYKTISGKKYYSTWSKAKAVTTKK